MFYTYVLQSAKDKNFYTGFTKNLKLRFEQHNKGIVESTKDRRPFKLIYYEACLHKNDAIRREKYLKSYHACPVEPWSTILFVWRLAYSTDQWKVGSNILLFHRGENVLEKEAQSYLTGQKGIHSILTYCSGIVIWSCNPKWNFS